MRVSTSLALAIVSLLFGNLSAQNNPKSTTDTMKGEKVLPADEAVLAHPIRRFEEQPWFEISNLRPGQNLTDALELDFVREGELGGPIHIVVLTNGKRYRFPVNAETLNNQIGTITCSYQGVSDRSPLGADIEAYVEMTNIDQAPGVWQSKNNGAKPVDPLYFKVSKSAVRGQVAKLTLAREIRSIEQDIYLKRKKKYSPPPPPPAGSTVLQPETPLIAGTPVLAAYQGDWLEAELITVQSGGLPVVHWPKLGHQGNRLMDRNHIAVRKEVLARLTSAPESFKPSVELPLDSFQPLPAGFVVLPDDVQLVPGTPLKLSRGRSLWDYVVVRDGDGFVTVLYAPHASQEESYPRKQFGIARDTIKKLNDPKTVAQLAARLKDLQSSVRAYTVPGGLGAARAYPPSAAIPAGYERVTNDTNLQLEDGGLVLWGSRWYPVVVKGLPESGDIEIKWEGWSRNELITRDSMVIAKKKTSRDSDVAANKSSNKASANKASAKTASAKPASADMASKPIESTPSTIPANEKAEEPSFTEGPADGKYSLTLIQPGRRRLATVKLVMQLADLDLRSATEALKDLPLELTRDLDRQQAQDWLKKFEHEEAKISIKPVKTK